MTARRPLNALRTFEAAARHQSFLKAAAGPGTWELIRQSVFWGFVLLVIASPAALSALILLHA